MVCRLQRVTREKQGHEYHKEYLSVEKQRSMCGMHICHM